MAKKMMFARLDFSTFLICCSGDFSANKSDEKPSVAICGGSICILTGLMADTQLLLSAALQFMMILLSLLSPGVPNYTYTGTKQDIDPVGVAITTSHDVVVTHFGLEKLHSFLVPGRCPDTDYRCRKESCSRSTIRAASRSARSFFMLFLLLSGDVFRNPGPRNWKYPCSVCHKPVTKNQDGLLCDQCDMDTS